MTATATRTSTINISSVLAAIAAAAAKAADRFVSVAGPEGIWQSTGHEMPTGAETWSWSPSTSVAIDHAARRLNRCTIYGDVRVPDSYCRSGGRILSIHIPLLEDVDRLCGLLDHVEEVVWWETRNVVSHVALDAAEAAHRAAVPEGGPYRDEEGMLVLPDRRVRGRIGFAAWKAWHDAAQAHRRESEAYNRAVTAQEARIMASSDTLKWVIRMASELGIELP